MEVSKLESSTRRAATYRTVMCVAGKDTSVCLGAYRQESPAASLVPNGETGLRVRLLRAGVPLYTGQVRAGLAQLKVSS